MINLQRGEKKVPSERKHEEEVEEEENNHKIISKGSSNHLEEEEKLDPFSQAEQLDVNKIYKSMQIEK